MKKQSVLESLHSATGRLSGADKLVAKLERNVPYIINWHGKDMLILITHFYKTGMRFKPLSAPIGYRTPERTSTIKYQNVPNHKFRRATVQDLPLYIGEGTPFYTRYFSDTKLFNKNHNKEI